MGSVIGKNAAESVTWLRSYVSHERRTTFCVYGGPSPEAVRAAAAGNGLPIGSITEVSVLDPYAYGRQR